MIKPEVGIHENVPEAEYHSWEGASCSRLKLIERSPAHCKASFSEGYDGTTESKKKGSALHCAVLEPDSFSARYHLFDGDRRYKEGKALWTQLLEITTEEYMLKKNEYSDVIGMKDAVYAHKAAAKLLENVDRTELSLAWKHDNVLCKGRIDGYSEKLKTIIDVKTTQDASFFAFQWAINKYKYHWQAQHYTSGAKALGLEVENYAIIAIENKAPFAVACYGLASEALEFGRHDLEEAIKKFGCCVMLDEWPAYGNEFEDISLPKQILESKKYD